MKTKWFLQLTGNKDVLEAVASLKPEWIEHFRNTVEVLDEEEPCGGIPVFGDIPIDNLTDVVTILNHLRDAGDVVDAELVCTANTDEGRWVAQVVIGTATAPWHELASWVQDRLKIDETGCVPTIEQLQEEQSALVDDIVHKAAILRKHRLAFEEITAAETLEGARETARKELKGWEKP